jgi:hypothetical protein
LELSKKVWHGKQETEGENCELHHFDLSEMMNLRWQMLAATPGNNR